MGPHPDQQRLVGLPRPVDAHVGQRGGRQHAADGVEGLSGYRLPVYEIGVRRRLGDAVTEVLVHVPDQVGVDVEKTIHVGDVASPQRRGQDLGIPVVAVPPTETGVIGDVPGGLLEVRHQASPFQDLGQQIGGLLTGQVHAPELGHAVVAVLEEDLVVELFGTT